MPDQELRSRKPIRGESGAVAVISALLIMAFMGMAAFAIDFGWLYLNGIWIQHGADAAALSGVIYEPGDSSTAYGEAFDAASENGYDDGDPGTTVDPTDFAEDSSAVFNSDQLRVTITDTVPTFFMKAFGLDSVSITKTSVAQYVLPLAMGSDWPYFGEDPTDSTRDPHYWANIHGYFTGRRMGDRFASQCNSGGAQSGCTPNPEARATVSAGVNNGFQDYTGGYLYGIEVPAGSDGLSVDVFDGPFYRGGNDYVLVGDNEQGGSVGPTTLFMLYGPDPTPLNTTDGNKLLCVVEYGPQDSFADFNGDGSVNSGDDQDSDGDLDWDDVEIGLSAAGGVDSLWDAMCGTSFSEGAGVYPLRVVIKDPGSSDDRGLNRFSLRASSSPQMPRVYGLSDMSVYVNFEGNEATFNLAEVEQVHAGKELVIELWDPDSGNQGVRIERPDGSLPLCSWSIDGDVSSTGSGGALIPCDISGYGPQEFNDHHMQIRIAISSGYTCSSDCWWTIKVTYPGGANDTTTWSARIEGNPVKLVK